MKRKWKMLALPIVIALSLTACSGEKVEDTEAEDNQVEVSVDEFDDSELINISAVELSDNYRSNEPMSDKEFRAERAEIVGSINGFGELEGKKYIILSGAEKEGSPLINCFFNEDFDMAELKEGDEITIIGTISGKQEIHGNRNNVVIENSRLK